MWDTLFELIQIEVQCSKNYFKFLLPQEAGAFRNNVEKKPQNLQIIFALSAIQCKW